MTRDERVTRNIARIRAGIQIDASSRFSRVVVPDNLLDRLYASSRETRRVVRKVNRARDYRRNLRTKLSLDERYKLDVDFSDDDGESFGEPLINPEGNRIYLIRLGLSQLHAIPLLHGFGILWNLPPGWVFADGLGSTTYERAVSNPLVVARTMRSPATPSRGSFELTVTAMLK